MKLSGDVEHEIRARRRDKELGRAMVSGHYSWGILPTLQYKIYGVLRRVLSTTPYCSAAPQYASPVEAPDN
jgi:hypothetical protein